MSRRSAEVEELCRIYSDGEDKAASVFGVRHLPWLSEVPGEKQPKAGQPSRIVKRLDPELQL